MKTVRFAAATALALGLAACSGDSIVGPSGSDSDALAGRKKNPPADTGTVTPPPPPPALPPSTTNPFAAASFYVDPNSNAWKQVAEWSSTRPTDAAQMEKIAKQPQAKWFGRWYTDIAAGVRDYLTKVSGTGGIPVLVAYNMYKLNCTTLGPSSPDAYRTWINAFASALGGTKTVVVLEPDAVAAWGCLSETDKQTRIELLRYAIATLKARPLTHVYLDAGHPRWQTPAEIAARLTTAGVASADGFALNVSNFVATAENISYGRQVSALIGGKHFVIDTSRNGLGSTADNQWCNPLGRALGSGATAFTADPLVDAYLWIKPPGESDGTCNGGPAAGVWWADYALGLAQRA